MPGYARGKAVEVWFQDEARVGQKGALARVWGLRGSRPRMMRDGRHASAYIFGAVCAARDKGVALVMPYANTHAMNRHLAEIGRAVATDAHAAVIVDGAGWHVARKLAVPENITLIKLPPYSPELNPQENVWQYLRQNYLAGLVFETYEDIVNACCKAWNALVAEAGRIKSIADRSWAAWKAS